MIFPPGGLGQMGVYFQDFGVIPAYSATRKARARSARFDKHPAAGILASLLAPGIPGA